jgi:preprotein translocase subunit SecE
VGNTTEQRAEGGATGGLRQLVEVVPRSVEFVKEAWQELKKVYWPTSKETYAATLIVVVVVVAVAVFLGLVDFGLTYAMRLVLNQG